MQGLFGILIFIIVIAVIIYIVKGIKIIHPGEAGIVERLGKAKMPVLEPGIHLVNPFLERIRLVIVKELTVDVPPQNIITKDNVLISADTVIFYRIIDPVKAVYAVNDLRRSIQHMAQITVRDIISEMTSEEAFCSRKEINDQLRGQLDRAVEPWGCIVDGFELKDIVVSRRFEMPDVTKDEEEMLKRAKDISNGNY